MAHRSGHADSTRSPWPTTTPAIWEGTGSRPRSPPRRKAGVDRGRGATPITTRGRPVSSTRRTDARCAPSRGQRSSTPTDRLAGCPGDLAIAGLRPQGQTGDRGSHPPRADGRLRRRRRNPPRRRGVRRAHLGRTTAGEGRRGRGRRRRGRPPSACTGARCRHRRPRRSQGPGVRVGGQPAVEPGRVVDHLELPGVAEAPHCAERLDPARRAGRPLLVVVGPGRAP